jgi:hypothetical protein
VIDIPWNQATGAVAGGLVGGFTGFVANGVLDRSGERRAKRNVASAIIGELQALCGYIETHYLAKLRLDLDTISAEARRHPYHGFRGERDYAPVFRSLGANMGFLPSPLPRDLVYWYTGLTVCLERARELHELAQRKELDSIIYAIEVAQNQHEAFKELFELAQPLIKRLSML